MRVAAVNLQKVVFYERGVAYGSEAGHVVRQIG